MRQQMSSCSSYQHVQLFTFSQLQQNRIKILEPQMSNHKNTIKMDPVKRHLKTFSKMKHLMFTLLLKH